MIKTVRLQNKNTNEDMDRNEDGMNRDISKNEDKVTYKRNRILYSDALKEI